jgi:uncharacterized membrane protein YbaN (DUF454 family)
MALVLQQYCRLDLLGHRLKIYICYCLVIGQAISVTKLIQLDEWLKMIASVVILITIYYIAYKSATEFTTIASKNNC